MVPGVMAEPSARLVSGVPWLLPAAVQPVDGQLAPEATQATFSVVPAFAVVGPCGVTTIWPSAVPVTAATAAGAFSGLAVASLPDEHTR